jgi:NAD(P)-dependent dehydrogenase (short-subunit alcohol dehydrogenase family)
MLLKDRVAIITGGSMGMGRSTALKFADEGCSVVIADIAESEGKKTADEVSKKGREAVFIKCDITDNRQIQDVVTKTIDKFGKIDILVNNAGGILGSKKGLIGEVSEEDWDKIVTLNLKSHFLFSKAVVPHMKKNKSGKIIFLSSMGAVNPSVPVMHYHTAKAGVIGLALNLALELASFNITVNTIVPGPIRTPFWNPLTKGMPDADMLFDMVAKKEVPMQRVGTPEDIAGVALFFASDLSAFVTGQSLCVAGGQPLKPLMETPLE